MGIPPGGLHQVSDLSDLKRLRKSIRCQITYTPYTTHHPEFFSSLMESQSATTSLRQSQQTKRQPEPKIEGDLYWKLVPLSHLKHLASYIRIGSFGIFLQVLMTTFYALVTAYSETTHTFRHLLYCSALKDVSFVVRFCIECL